MTLWQFVGVVLTMIGGVLIAFEDKINACLSGRGNEPIVEKKNTITIHANEIPVL